MVGTAVSSKAMPTKTDNSNYHDFLEWVVRRKFKSLTSLPFENVAEDAGGKLALQVCGAADVWWIALKPLDIREEPSAAAPLASQACKGKTTVRRGDALWCLEVCDLWLRVTRVGPFAGYPAGASLGWVPWSGTALHDDGVLLKPLLILESELRHHNPFEEEVVELPLDAFFWSVQEVQLFLTTSGDIGPSRTTALDRSSKKSVRGVRRAPTAVEYRVDSTSSSGGVFSRTYLVAGTIVEICPLHRITRAAAERSGVLGGLCIAMRPTGGAETQPRLALPLGYARLYGSSSGPNLHWGYHGDEDLVLWAARDLFIGQELTVNFDLQPRDPPMKHHGQPLPDWNQELLTSTGKIERSGCLEHRPSTAHGRGVFALRDYSVGELLETCPLALLDEVGAEAMISYRWGLEGNADADYFLPYGLGAMYNHYEPPHVRAKLDKGRRVLEIYVEKPIQCGQEIFITYGAAYFDDDFAQLGHGLANYKAPPPLPLPIERAS